jgi:lipopolysaccharide transport system ATP-binding protein
MSTVIRLEGVGKKYRLRHQQAAHYKTLREIFSENLSGFGRRMLRGRQQSRIIKEDFWALQDISFAVEQGERLGIIGRNGAGKSTLLKLLSRITAPSKGRILLKGRVGSLLEVGTGFHPELTGRENIFLNGAILGMNRVEIRSKFDEIVAFAEVEKFLDTPVKRYSSGMYVRLAFAVAAHLDTDILLVDEVLAVGDAQFQKKCLGKMNDISINEGRTILFVSHNLAAIKNLCTKSMLLEKGQNVAIGSPAEVIERYILDNSSKAAAINCLRGFPRTAGNQEAIQEAWVENGSHQVVTDVLMGSPVYFCFRFKANKSIIQPGFGFGIETIFGQRIFSMNNYMSSKKDFDAMAGGVAIFYIPELQLLPGKYFVSLSIVENHHVFIDFAERALHFNVVENDVFGTGNIPQSSHGMTYVKGMVTVRLS